MRAVRASGPGGQNVNKVSSKVELELDVVGTEALDNEAKKRLLSLAGRLVIDERWLRVTSQLTRDQPKNLEDARQKLTALVLRALTRPKARRPTKPTRASKERRLDEKRRASDKKDARRTRSDGA